MRVTILGCGGSAGVPQIGGCGWPRRLGASATRRSRAIAAAGRAWWWKAGRARWLLVDTGPDLRTQLMACGVPGVDAILFTHAHADHITGLDDIRILNRIAGRPLAAYATQGTLDELNHGGSTTRSNPGSRRASSARCCCASGPRLATRWRWPACRVRLSSRTHGLRHDAGAADRRVRVFDGCGDAGRFRVRHAGRVDVWVVDCFQRAGHTTHAHLDRVLDWAGRVGARRTILTHMGYDMDWDWLQRHLPPGCGAGV